MPDLPQTIRSGELKLEGVIQMPPAGVEKVPAVVLCHPHPLYGGNLQNNVVMAVSQTLVKRGFITLRFNFRGVGLSEGEFDDGRGEKDDLWAAVETAAGLPEVDRNRLGVMGYSFGGMVALAAAKNIDLIRAVSAVSPVLTADLLNGLNKPSYFICGTMDHVVQTDLLIGEAEKMTPPGEVEMVQGVDHFWFGREDIMAKKVAAFFERTL